MKKIREAFFPAQNEKIFKGFGPAFLAIALGIGSGEFILWPYISAHYGFGLLWGAVLGITFQLIIIVALERYTAFFGEDVLSFFSKIFPYSFYLILFLTLIGFAWPGFASMIAQLLVLGFHLSLPEIWISFFVLVLAGGILLLGKSAYKNILFVQKVNMSFLLILVSFLFIWYFDIESIQSLFLGLFGKGEHYLLIPAGLSFVTFLGAVAYAGSGGTLLLMNSFYAEKEEKGLVLESKNDGEFIIPQNEKRSIENAKNFVHFSWKQNFLFFWFAGLVLIILLAYVSYTTLYEVGNVSKDFTFLIQEAHIFSRDIHPILGKLFILSGAFALFGVQLGILDFMGRLAGNKPGFIYNSLKQKKYYRFAVIGMILFAFLIFAFGISQPHTLIIIGSTLNAFAMGIIAYLLYCVEKKLIPKYLFSSFFSIMLPIISIFYVVFFLYVILQKFL